MANTTTQLDAVRVLAGIVRRAEEAGLPRLSWSLPHHGEELSAQVPARSDDETKTIAMAAWGAHLGVKADVKRHDDHTQLTIVAVVDGVPVGIFCHVGRAATYGRTGGAK